MIFQFAIQDIFYLIKKKTNSVPYWNKQEN